MIKLLLLIRMFLCQFLCSVFLSIPLLMQFFMCKIMTSDDTYNLLCDVVYSIIVERIATVKGYEIIKCLDYIQQTLYRFIIIIIIIIIIIRKFLQ